MTGFVERRSFVLEFERLREICQVVDGDWNLLMVRGLQDRSDLEIDTGVEEQRSVLARFWRLRCYKIVQQPRRTPLMESETVGIGFCAGDV